MPETVLGAGDMTVNKTVSTLTKILTFLNNILILLNNIYQVYIKCQLLGYVMYMYFPMYSHLLLTAII